MTPFRVNIADLVHRPGARRRERVSGRLSSLRVLDTMVPADREVVVDTTIEWVSEGALASGSVSAPWASECRRCLVPVTGETTVPFRELFETSPREGESYPLRGDHIDLEPLAREAVMVELPLAPLCREDCQGLCPTCGTDLNQGRCSCPPGEGDSRWRALDELGEDTE